MKLMLITALILNLVILVCELYALGHIKGKLNILYLFTKFLITDYKSYLFRISDHQYNFWRNDAGICKRIAICYNLWAGSYNVHIHCFSW